MPRSTNFYYLSIASGVKSHGITDTDSARRCKISIDVHEVARHGRHLVWAGRGARLCKCVYDMRELLREHEKLESTLEH